MTVLTDRRANWDNILTSSRCFDKDEEWMTGLQIVDTFEGKMNDPQSLHKYLYCHDDPVNMIDPLGEAATWNQYFGYEVEDEIEKLYSSDPRFRGNNVTYGKWARLSGDNGLFRAKPDILDHDRKRYMEIKPLSPSGVSAAAAQMLKRDRQFRRQGYRPDPTWHVAPSVIYPWGIPTIFFNMGGVLFYTDAIELAADCAVATEIGELMAIARSGRLAYTIEVALGRSFGLAQSGRAADSARLNGGLTLGLSISIGFGF